MNHSIKANDREFNGKRRSDSASRVSRREFLKKSLAAAAAVPMLSFEERNLLAQAPAPGANAVNAANPAGMPRGKIGSIEISRLICGGNLISGYAHSRDLIYVSRLLKAYFTDAKIMETWSLCEQQGINTMIFNPGDKHALEVFTDYRRQGGKMQCVAQVDAPKDNMEPFIREIVDTGVDAMVLVGNLGDAWSREGKVDLIGKFVETVQMSSIVAGVAGHELRTPMSVEKAGIKPDFYMKTFHSTNYWSKRRPDQNREVIDNYAEDNYWCMDSDATRDFMATVKRPWLAYKVLAAGAIHPEEGFKHAFENGADFCVVGMFDFQVSENVAIARDVLSRNLDRKRAWLA
jgi:hypothetical protein